MSSMGITCPYFFFLFWGENLEHDFIILSNCFILNNYYNIYMKGKYLIQQEKRKIKSTLTVSIMSKLCALIFLGIIILFQVVHKFQTVECEGLE